MKTLTNETELTWDARPFSLTLAGCLALAGMELPEPTAFPEGTPLTGTLGTFRPAFDDTGTAQQAADAHVETVAFGITDEKSANWYLRKLATMDTEKIRVKAQTEKMLSDLDADTAGLKFLYEGELQEFVRQELARKGGKKKTLHLIQGTCSFRSVPASVKVSDTNAALAYAKANGLPCIVLSERVDCEEYKKLDEGAMLPGMDSTEARENFSVTFGNK